MAKINLVLLVTLCVVCIQSFSAAPIAEKSDDLIIDGHDLDTFLELTLKKAIRPYAKRMIECTPELNRLTVADVEEILTSVEYSAQFVMRELLTELEGYNSCSEEKKDASTDVQVKTKDVEAKDE